MTFFGDSSITFINYDGKRDFAYRQEARIHNAHRRIQSSRATASSGPAQKDQAITRRRHRVTVEPATDLIDPLSSYAGDPFGPNRDSQPRAVESIWRALFQDCFHLPRVSRAFLELPDPEESFLAAARASQHAYQNIVTLTVAVSKARKGSQMAEPVYRTQARIIQDFRKLVAHHAAFDTQLTRHECQDLFISAFSFSDRDFCREPAYNAIILVNSSLLIAPQNCMRRQLPTVEWIRMLTPRPGPSFHRPREYDTLMLRKINLLFDFLEEAQTNAQAGLAESVSSYFRPDTALYKIVTTKAYEGPSQEPFRGFHLICLHRTLFLLHAHIAELGQNSSFQTDIFLPTLETLASRCLGDDPQKSIALFLWGVLSNAESQGKCLDAREPVFSWAMKELYLVHSLSFVDQMITWLPHKDIYAEEARSAPWNANEIRGRMQVFYQSD